MQLSCITGASMSVGITGRLSQAEPILYVPWRENLKFDLIKYAEVKNFNITTGNQFLYTLYLEISLEIFLYQPGTLGSWLT